MFKKSLSNTRQGLGLAKFFSDNQWINKLYERIKRHSKSNQIFQKQPSTLSCSSHSSNSSIQSLTRRIVRLREQRVHLCMRTNSCSIRDRALVCVEPDRRGRNRVGVHHPFPSIATLFIKFKYISNFPSLIPKELS